MENAIIHGLSKKEQGGKILLRVWKKEDKVIISVADTGVGMSQERLMELRTALNAGGTARVGIGLGNICHRIHAMYRTVTSGYTAAREMARWYRSSYRRMSMRKWEAGIRKQHRGDYMLRLLIADDEVIERKVLYKTLQKNIGDQCVIFQAENGRQALRVYEEEKNPDCNPGYRNAWY